MQVKKFNHPLMNNNITKSDIGSVISFLKTQPILTQHKRVEEFEKKWSKWLGVKYSVFVNSGSSANFMTMSAVKNVIGDGEVMVPALTWPSDIQSVILNNMKIKIVDINLYNLSVSFDSIKKNLTKKTKYLFITHAQGFNGLSKDIINFCKNKKITIIEDVCESHGATFENKKLGCFGLVSNFSFYYAHHLSTIEGGMICTNDKKIYDYCIMMRGHGMLRESKFKDTLNKFKLYPDLNPKFIFLNAGFNFRNNEIGAIIGINQIKRLDKNIKLRNRNFKYFLKKLNNKIYFTDYDLSGISNYAFPIILKKSNIQYRNKFEKLLTKNNIEFRRGNAGGGNQLRQPYLKQKIKKLNLKNYFNTEKVHHFGYYIGNYPDLKLSKIDKIVKILNRFNFN